VIAWNSAAAMGRLSRSATLMAVVGLAAGLVSLLLDLPVAVPAFIIGTAAVLVALFAGFRRSHLDDISRSG
jgi:hypothetical protein